MGFMGNLPEFPIFLTILKISLPYFFHQRYKLPKITNNVAEKTNNAIASTIFTVFTNNNGKYG